MYLYNCLYKWLRHKLSINAIIKYIKYFILIILQFTIVELAIWFHTCGLGWHVEELLPGDAISL